MEIMKIFLCWFTIGYIARHIIAFIIVYFINNSKKPKKITKEDIFDKDLFKNLQKKKLKKITIDDIFYKDMHDSFKFDIVEIRKPKYRIDKVTHGDGTIKYKVYYMGDLISETSDYDAAKLRIEKIMNSEIIKTETVYPENKPTPQPNQTINEKNETCCKNPEKKYGVFIYTDRKTNKEKIGQRIECISCGEIKSIF